MSFLKPKPATSDNQAYGLIKSTYSPVMNQGVGANNFLSALLTGQGDTTGASAGYQNYLQQAGYATAMREMTRGTIGTQAAGGLLNSGSTQRALQSRGAEINQGFYNNYLQQLTGLSGLGLQAGGLVTNAGSRSTQPTPGLFGTLASGVGGIASLYKAGAFSDRRLKHAIEKVGEFADGLGIYIFSYLGRNERHHGVMADEVERLRPWALGPRIAGYATVNYGAL